MTRSKTHPFWRVFYDRAAFAYDSVLSLGAALGVGSELRIRRELLANLVLPHNARVLEIGCGTGANRPFLSAGADYVGIDLSRQMLRRALAKDLAASAFAQADGVALPLESHRFDLLLAMGVVQHIAEPARMFAEMQRSAADGAQLLLIEERRATNGIARKFTGPKGGLEDLARELSKKFNWDLLNCVFYGEYFVLHYKVTH
jgi:ubiquinone/menaquinone biosynthesis C-methylase UbiE